MSTMDTLKPQLRDQLSVFSDLLRGFMAKYDPKKVGQPQRDDYTRLTGEVLHLSKEMAYAYSDITNARNLEPTISDAEIIQESIRKYERFGRRFEKIVIQYGLDRDEFKPFFDSITQSIQLGKEALEKEGGPRPRRSFKFEMEDLWRKEVIFQLSKHMSGDPARRRVEQQVMKDTIDPEINKIYDLAEYVGSGKLGFSDVARISTNSRKTISMACAQHEMPEMAAFLGEKLDQLQSLCSHYVATSRGAEQGRA